MSKVTKIENDIIHFDTGEELFSYHQSDCCERHYLSMSDLSINDFDGLEFDLSNDDFFQRVEGYGIKLIPTNGHPIPIPGYGSNNGWYSSNLSMILKRPNSENEYAISECQVITY